MTAPTSRPDQSPFATRLETLAATLRAEIAALEATVAQLHTEQSLLVATTPDGLVEAMDKREPLLAALARARDARAAAMQANGLPRDPIAAELRLQAHKAVHALWTRMRRLAREASVLQSVNSRLVAQQHQYVTGRLDLLKRARGASDVYDAKGRNGLGGESRTIAAA